MPKRFVVQALYWKTPSVMRPQAFPGVGNSQRDTFCYTLNGEGCAYALPGWGNRVSQFFEPMFPKITRIYLALDCRDHGQLCNESVVKAFENHAFRTANAVRIMQSSASGLRAKPSAVIMPRLSRSVRETPASSFATTRKCIPTECWVTNGSGQKSSCVLSIVQHLQRGVCPFLFSSC